MLFFIKILCILYQENNRFWYQKRLEKYNTFKEFVKDLSNILNEDEKIMHLTPQNDYIQDNDGNTVIDKIIKLENIDNELNEFCLENNLECPKELPKRNKSKHKDYREYYDKETQDLVYNFYKKDFDLLGYDYEL